jgi:hypothetical protein
MQKKMALSDIQDNNRTEMKRIAGSMCVNNCTSWMPPGELPASCYLNCGASFSSMQQSANTNCASRNSTWIC